MALIVLTTAFAADPDAALLEAVHQDDAPLVDRLLAAGANPRTPNRYGITPLLEACESGDAAIIDKLLKAGADPNTAQPEGESVLMTAARTGNPDAVKILLDRGARVNAKENWRGQTALMWAVAENHSAVVKLLLDHGADVNARSRVFDYTSLQPKQGSVPMNYPRGGFTPLLFAARQGDLADTQLLLGAKADINLADPDKTTPLLEAILNFHFDLAAYLLDHGADPNARDIHGRSPLYAAVDMHSLDTSTRPNPVVSDKLDSLEIIQALLARKANPNAQLIEPVPPRGPLDVADYTMGEGATPFLRAAKAADLEVMRLLLSSGADPLLPTKAGVTPLMAAAGVGWRDGKSRGTEADAIEAIKICLDYGAKLNTAVYNGPTKGQTALHGASIREANDVVAFLLSHGADPNAIDDKGHRALGMLVQSFSANVPAEGTRVPASLACAACTGNLTATSTAEWLVITSANGGQIGFNVLPNPTPSSRTAAIQVVGTTNKVTLTITQSQR